jgi:hypothetical protein
MGEADGLFTPLADDITGAQCREAWRFLKLLREPRKGAKRGLYAEGLLISPDGEIWRACSGGWNRGELPTGTYSIGKVRPPNSPEKDCFRDRAGNDPWFCPILFHKACIDRDNLGIHPDGSKSRKGPNGTSGCIGLLDLDTKPTKTKLEQSRGMLLVVSYSR